MGLNEIPKRTEPKAEVSHEVPKHNRVFTGPRKSERVIRTPETVLRAEYDKAAADLQQWNVSETLIFLEGTSKHLLEVYLLAEEGGRARPEVLRSFPKPGQSARQRLSALLAPSKTPRARKGLVAQEA